MMMMMMMMMMTMMTIIIIVIIPIVMIVFIVLVIIMIIIIIIIRIVMILLIMGCLSDGCPSSHAARKGTTGVSTNGVTANVMFLFNRGTFRVLPLTYFYLPKSARAYLFPQSVKFITFAAAPLVLTPFVRNQQAHHAGSQ